MNNDSGHGLQMNDEPYKINLNDFNDDGENVLHLGMTIIYYSQIKIGEVYCKHQLMCNVTLHFLLLIFSFKTATTV